MDVFILSPVVFVHLRVTTDLIAKKAHSGSSPLGT